MTAWKLYCETCGDDALGFVQGSPWSPDPGLTQQWFDGHEVTAHSGDAGQQVQLMVPLSQARQSGSRACPRTGFSGGGPCGDYCRKITHRGCVFESLAARKVLVGY